MAYTSTKPIPLFDGHSTQQSRTLQADNRLPASHVSIFAAKRKEKPGSGGARPEYI